MFSKIWLINIILGVFIIFFAVKTYDVWFAKKEKEEIRLSATENNENYSVKEFSKRNLPSESNYRVIVDKNLFREERTEYLPDPEPDAELEPSSESEPEIKTLDGFGVKIELYGVVIWKDYKKALITNTERERGKTGEKWVEKGDTILEIKRRNKDVELIVDEIFEDRILVKGGDDRYEILLYDKDNPKKRANVARNRGPKVVSSASDPAKKQKIVKKSAPSKGQETKKKPNVKKASPSEPEYEVINTPFGEIKRRKQ